MRVLNSCESQEISGSDITCSVGFPSGIVCTGPAADFGAAAVAAYDYAVQKTADLFCWLGGV